MSVSPFRTPQPPARGKGEFLHPSTGKPPRHPSSEAKDSAYKSSARNLASSSLMSPGIDGSFGKILSPSASANVCIATPCSEGKKSFTGSESPFREWAQNSLGCLADVESPERDAVMLPPSYSAVKMEHSPNMASRDEDLTMTCKPAVLEHSLTEAATEFPPSGLGQVHKSGGKTAASKKSIKKGGRGDMGLALEEGECSRHLHHEAPPDSPPVHHLATLDPLDHNLFTPQPHVHGIPRKPLTLVECHLFTFELIDNKVVADGFEETRAYDDGRFSHSRSKSRSTLFTPSFHYAESPGDENLDAASDGRKRICSCKKSRCLKLYCECFAAAVLCDGCKCVECENDGNHETQRLQAVDNIKQRNSNAFAAKIVEEEEQEKNAVVGAHARGCRCKKSHCLKKYCECFQAQVKCTDKCKCEDCKNRCDDTPRERAEAALSALMHQSDSKGSSPESTGNNTARKRGHPALSPPRNKKPRVLDFNVTPSHSTPSSSSSLGQAVKSPSSMLIKAP